MKSGKTTECSPLNDRRYNRIPERNLRYNRLFVNILLNFYRFYLITFGGVVIKFNQKTGKSDIKTSKFLKKSSWIAIVISVVFLLCHGVNTTTVKLRASQQYGSQIHLNDTSNQQNEIIQHAFSSTTLFLQQMINLYYIQEIFTTLITFQKGGIEVIRFLLKYPLTKPWFWKLLVASFFLIVYEFLLIIGISMSSRFDFSENWMRSVPFLHWLAFLVPTFTSCCIVWTVATVAGGFCKQLQFETEIRLSRVNEKSAFNEVMLNVRKRLSLFRKDFTIVNASITPILLALIIGNIISTTLSVNKIVNTTSQSHAESPVFVKISFLANAIIELLKLVSLFIMSDSIQKKALELDKLIDDFLAVNCLNEVNLISSPLKKNPLCLSVAGININTNALLTVFSFILSYTVIIAQTS